MESQEALHGVMATPKGPNNLFCKLPMAPNNRMTKYCPRPMIHGFAATQIGTIVHKFVGGLQT